MISLELGPDEVETAICEWLRLRYRIDAPIERVVVKRNGGVDVMLSPTESEAERATMYPLRSTAAE